MSSPGLARRSRRNAARSTSRPTNGKAASSAGGATGSPRVASNSRHCSTSPFSQNRPRSTNVQSPLDASARTVSDTSSWPDVAAFDATRERDRDGQTEHVVWLLRRARRRAVPCEREETLSGWLGVVLVQAVHGCRARTRPRRSAVGNTTRKPSPVDFTTHPSCSAAAARTACSCTRINATATSSPRSLLNAVDPSMSVKSTVFGRVAHASTDPGGLCGPRSSNETPTSTTQGGEFSCRVRSPWTSSTSILTTERYRRCAVSNQDVLERLRERRFARRPREGVGRARATTSASYLEAHPADLCRKASEAALAQALDAKDKAIHLQYSPGYDFSVQIWDYGDGHERPPERARTRRHCTATGQAGRQGAPQAGRPQGAARERGSV